MKQRRILAFLLAVTMAVSCLGGSAFAEGAIKEGRRLVTQMWSTGVFRTDISGGKCKAIGPDTPLSSKESMDFIAMYYPADADIDFGIMDADNTFYYINSGSSGTCTVSGGVAVPENGWYRVVIRNNSHSEVSAYGIVSSSRQ